MATLIYDLFTNPSGAFSRLYLYRYCVECDASRVPENVSSLVKESFSKARSQETFVVQFAFNDSPFVPDFKQSVLSLEENKYPVVTADFFAWNID
ncbi:MAG: hypothetical protein GQ525_05705 [Draconibacterium sp.]|nr:hypothetical protein [Draconibacterium sp.]